MIRYATTRILSSILVLWMISVIAFALMNILPGDPASALLGINATPSDIAEFRERLGLNDPLLERYADWLTGAMHGDLGASMLTGIPITELFEHRAPATLELGLLALIVIVTVAIPVGVVAALRPGSRTEVAASTLMIAGNSIPEFLTSIGLIIVISLELGWLPVVGYEPIWEDLVQNLRHMALPVIAISLTATTLLMRQTRSAMINVLNDDYIRTARAKGLSQRAVLVRHALRNALVPIITVFGFQVGLIFSGAVITEQVFAIPGMGSLFVEAVVVRKDYSVVQNTVMFFAVMTILVNLIIDLSYPFIDPRIRVGRGG